MCMGFFKKTTFQCYVLPSHCGLLLRAPSQLQHQSAHTSAKLILSSLYFLFLHCECKDFLLVLLIPCVVVDKMLAMSRSLMFVQESTRLFIVVALIGCVSSNQVTYLSLSFLISLLALARSKLASKPKQILLTSFTCS